MSNEDTNIQIKKLKKKLRRYCFFEKFYLLQKKMFDLPICINLYSLRNKCRKKM